jgi:hypothetical protein
MHIFSLISRLRRYSKRSVFCHLYCFAPPFCISSKAKDPDVPDRKIAAEDNPCGVLLRALERVRTRLAIAIARESKVTTQGRRRYYLDTEERIRCMLKDLRCQRWQDMTWNEAIEALRRIPDFPDPQEEKIDAQAMCRRLREVMAILERRSNPG